MAKQLIRCLSMQEPFDEHSKEEIFRLIWENSTDLIAVVDNQGQRLLNSPSYEKTLGRGTDIEGTNSFQEVHPDDQKRLQDIFTRTLATGKGERTEYRMRLADGTIRYIESQGSVIRDQQGRPDKVVVVSRDITERTTAMQELQRTVAQLNEADEALRAAQAKLVESERMAAVSTFAAGIAHEVKNPLQVILLAVDFLKTSVSSGPAKSPGDLSPVLTEMEKAAKKADAVIRGLLEFSSYGKQEIVDVDLNQCLRLTAQAVQSDLEARNLELITSYANDLPLVRIDEAKAKHILLRILLLSIEKTESRGRLHLSSAVEKGNDKEATQAVITLKAVPVWPSTSPSLMSQTDDDFGHANLDQTDLEVLVIRKVIELFGGKVEAENSPEPGLVIRLRFPVDSSPDE